MEIGRSRACTSRLKDYKKEQKQNRTRKMSTYEMYSQKIPNQSPIKKRYLERQSESVVGKIKNELDGNPFVNAVSSQDTSDNSSKSSFEIEFAIYDSPNKIQSFQNKGCENLLRERTGSEQIPEFRRTIGTKEDINFELHDKIPRSRTIDIKATRKNDSNTEQINSQKNSEDQLQSLRNELEELHNQLYEKEKLNGDLISQFITRSRENVELRENLNVLHAS
mmetsp:Transcript_23451/g.20837  ORF Transcript_23451/g.20837 Transcript_23451/m.20837 type:complete len:222 (+) Transcript_23451:34-699(+)